MVWLFLGHSSYVFQGVNLGGWLITEPFIVPALYEKYQVVTPNPAIPGGQAVDEWTLSVAMRNDTTPGGGIEQLERHYKSFIVSHKRVAPGNDSQLYFTFRRPSKISRK